MRDRIGGTNSSATLRGTVYAPIVTVQKTAIAQLKDIGALLLPCVELAYRTSALTVEYFPACLKQEKEDKKKRVRNREGRDRKVRGI